MLIFKIQLIQLILTRLLKNAQTLVHLQGEQGCSWPYRKTTRDTLSNWSMTHLPFRGILNRYNSV